ncbi:hypothetical protein SAMN05421824_0145 [Hyunsoonleella jejuensis]|uniref:Colicin import membrane protein n=1 Tax=Hyunsoonleella jejuensis TaxID=419940 RepID=A0A1H9A683_9FLAO|nr:hypothetical protein [Hyunsoonleella jejuensis]SEP72154.1 hypothetical protein SAMN05421824_0145 [Hyunsoonleella jejuensis]
MRVVVFLCFVSFSFLLSAQAVKINNDVYEVKNNIIFKNGIDVSSTISADEKSKVLAAFDKNKLETAKTKAVSEKLENAEKDKIKAEKQQKKAEKKQKKAEQALKRKERAHSNHNKAINKHKAAVKKYEKLKKKGKLSPEDERKWLEKIEKFNAGITKTKKKLK